MPGFVAPALGRLGKSIEQTGRQTRDRRCCPHASASATTGPAAVPPSGIIPADQPVRHSPRAERGPVDGAGPDEQNLADPILHPTRDVRLRQLFDRLHQAPRIALFDLAQALAGKPLPSGRLQQLLVGPGDEEDISESRVLDGGSGDEAVGEGEVNGCKIQFVARPVRGQLRGTCGRPTCRIPTA